MMYQTQKLRQSQHLISTALHRKYLVHRHQHPDHRYVQSKPLTVRYLPKNETNARGAELNFYSKLISKVDPLTNTPMFRAIQIQLACAACIAEEKAHECQHMAHLIPRWQDSEKHRKLKTIMSDRAVTLCRCCFFCYP